MNFHHLQSMQGILELSAGEYHDIRIRCPAYPLHAWIKIVTPSHCGGEDENVAAYALEADFVIIAAQITSPMVYLTYCIIWK